MKLNFDCIRDILLRIEENTGYRKSCYFYDLDLFDAIPGQYNVEPYQVSLSKDYDNDVLLYHLRYCINAKLLIIPERSDSDRITIEDLTPSGHDFLASIRKKSNWETIKAVADQVGSRSLPTLSSIASQVIAAIIKQHLDLS